jgi:type II secretory pathway predicted ATPase ExeA
MSRDLNIYTRHFGLSERPFSLVPDPDFLYWSSAHTWAYTMLEYGILTRAPIILITGDIGTGKTTLVHHLLRTMQADLRVGLISNASGNREELLHWIMQSLDQPTAADDTHVDLFARFQTYLIDAYARGERVVLIFDEAQNLSDDSLEELRMFTNINSGKDELLQLVMVGQPELRDRINRPALRQLAQRVSSAFHLPAMERQTVAAYITHRMQVAGTAYDVFDAAACDAIFAATGGVPRLVNQLCDLCLLYAYSAGLDAVTELTVDVVLNDDVFFPELGHVEFISHTTRRAQCARQA